MEIDSDDLQLDNEKYSYSLKIPSDRIAVLIGKSGSIKKELEIYSESQILVDSKEGNVTLVSKNSIKLYELKNVVKAIARGFNPDIAKLLFKQDYSLEILNLSEFNAHKNHQQRLKGRVIGRKGKSREIIEELTNCYISIYGKTIAIVGSIIDVPIAKKAVESLLMGSMHASVYKWLEKQRNKNKLDSLGF